MTSRRLKTLISIEAELELRTCYCLVRLDGSNAIRNCDLATPQVQILRAMRVYLKGVHCLVCTTTLQQDYNDCVGGDSLPKTIETRE